MPLNHRKPGYFAEGSLEVEPPSQAGEGGIRRLAIHKESLITRPAEGIDTVPDIITYAAREHGNSNAMGWRDIIDIHEEVKEIKKKVDDEEVIEKKTWKYFELSDYKYISYVQLKEAISEAARGFVALGIQKDAVVDIFAETRFEQPPTLMHVVILTMILYEHQPQLADNIACMCINLDHNSNSIRHPWRVWPHSLLVRAIMRRHLYQPCSAAHASQSSTSHPHCDICFLRWVPFTRHYIATSKSPA